MNEGQSIQGDTVARLSLRGIAGLRPLYILPEDPLAEEVLVPSFEAASSVDSMVGFFSSEALAALAPGLATFINRSTGTFRLIISPFLRPEDKDAIENGISSPESIAAEALQPLVVTEDLIQTHTLQCLSWLIRAGRIEIKIALMNDALFHPKVWLFHGPNEVVAVHGSSNLTYSGIRKNIEQIAVSKSWMEYDQRFTTERLDEQFDDLWNDKIEDCIIVRLPLAIRNRLLLTYKSHVPPNENDLRELYARANRYMHETQETYLTIESKKNLFKIPSGLRFEDGPFEHQGKAVNAWCEAAFRGVLEMATGSGKTIAAMIAANRLYSLCKPLLIVIAAPYIPLIQQWCDEIVPFGITPTNLTKSSGPKGRANELRRIGRRIRHGSTSVEAIVVSYHALSDHDFRAKIAEFNCTTLLIGDEVHNLGSERFVSDPPSFFDYRLGLSATPIRQFDQEGTEALFDFFGPVVYRYGLEEAIGNCLVEYDYHIHPVELTPDEIDRWSELTARIKANSWRAEDGKPDDYLAKLFRDRRLILETAEKKIDALQNALEFEDLPSLRHTLIYGSDKDPGQLEAINRLLREKGVLFHQLTYQETSNREQTKRIIESFQDGTLRVLTAKRVLDEGVNIPQIQKAFILASTTVERQWVQRRGRLLRRCAEIGKTHSVLHDFIALPPNLVSGDTDIRALVRSELRRVQEFASLARNAGRPNGPLAIIDKLVEAAYF